MFRSDAKTLAKAISETQSLVAKPEAKRSSLSMSILQAAEAIEFISSRYFSFTTKALADEMETSDTSARRILRTLETKGWVERVDGKLSPGYVPNGAHGEQHFRTLKRVKGV